MIQLGDEVKCTITGFKGVAFARCNYLYGCEQIMVKPKGVDKTTGSPKESKWIDEPQLEIVKEKNKVKAKPRHGAPTEKSPDLK